MQGNPNHNTIRGLQIFINDIRDCKTREAESKRIESELEKIRKKFSSTKALSGYDKKKYVWKLLYIYILGYKVDFGFNYAADLITSIKITEKMTGYVCLSLLCKENSQEISVMINSIRNDLIEKNSLPQSLALSLATNLNNPELLIEISSDVVLFLTKFKEKQPGVVKKAMICLTKILKIKKEIHDINSWPSNISKMIEIKNFEILLSLTNFVLNIFQIVGSNGYHEVAMKFFNNILYKLKEAPDEYTYYNIRTPWLQIKIMKILQCINPNLLNAETLKNIKNYIEYIGTKTQEVIIQDIKFTRFYSHYCVFFEAVNLLDHMNLKLNYNVFEKYISILGNFLQDNSRKYPNKDVNTKYLALDSLSKLCRYSKKEKIYNEHFNMIVGSIRDNDLSLRRRALDLLFIIATEESVKIICKELLLYLNEDEPTLKEEVALKVAILADKYADEYIWYIDTILKMMEVAGDFVTEDIFFRFYQIVVGFEDQEPNEKIKLYAVEKICKMLDKDYVFNPFIKIAAFLLGEYGIMLVNSKLK
jgi:AP-2 complex subunit alpha